MNKFQHEKAMTIMGRVVILSDQRLEDGSRDVWAAAPSSTGGWYTVHLRGVAKRITVQWCACAGKGDCYHARGLLLKLIEAERPTGGWRPHDTCDTCEGGPDECECAHNAPVPRHLDPDYIEYIREQYGEDVIVKLEYDEFSVRYRITGSTDDVSAAIGKLMREYPPQGYGTYVQSDDPLVDGRRLVMVSRSRSSD